MKKSICVVLVTLIVLLNNVTVTASSGQLRKDSIKTCNGITYGAHSADNHWHIAEEQGGRYYAVGNPIYSDPCNYTDSSSDNRDYTVNNESNSYIPSSISNQDKEPTKSSDTTLKSIIIDGEEVEVRDNINYATDKETVDIKVTLNDEKAKYEIINNSVLKLGDNQISIKVTAEDDTEKIYNINVRRNKVLSSNAGIKIIINGETVKFTNDKATVYVGATKSDLKIDYKLDDSNAKVQMTKINKLKIGDNKLDVNVTAEDGTKKKYEITVHRYTIVEEISSFVVGLVLLFGIGYGIYRVVNKIKK